MRTYDLPLITSCIDLAATPKNSFRTVRDIINDATDVVRDFLKVTSLSQLVWHEWAFVDVYERIENTEQHKLIFRKLSDPKVKSPVSAPITHDGYSNEFINSAWIGYSKQLDEKYGFNTALEWLIESIVSDIAETKFLTATTCFEMLMDKFHSQNGSEFLLDDITYKEYSSDLRKYASNILKSKGVDPTIRSSIYSTFSEMKRRSYVDKAKMLIDYWGISYDDTGITLDEIKNVRNDITHRGKYRKEGKIGLTEIIKTYSGLMSILTRIFLAMLCYHKYYQDPWIGKWIEFNSVCSKIGRPGFSIVSTKSNKND